MLSVKFPVASLNPKSKHGPPTFLQLSVLSSSRARTRNRFLEGTSRGLSNPWFLNVSSRNRKSPDTLSRSNQYGLTSVFFSEEDVDVEPTAFTGAVGGTDVSGVVT